MVSATYTHYSKQASSHLLENRQVKYTVPACSVEQVDMQTGKVKNITSTISLFTVIIYWPKAFHVTKCL